MRVSAGINRGLRLRSTRGTVLRPTATKVKEALFNVLGPRVIGATFVDFFAGTGNVGIEALSREAAHVVFVEKHRPSISLLKSNLSRCGLTHKATIYTRDATDYLQRVKKWQVTFDILFADPPYHGPLAESFLRCLGNSDIIKKSSIVVFEHFHKLLLPETAGCLELVRRYRYGDALLSFYQSSSRGAEPR